MSQASASGNRTRWRTRIVSHQATQLFSVVTAVGCVLSYPLVFVSGDHIGGTIGYLIVAIARVEGWTPVVFEFLKWPAIPMLLILMSCVVVSRTAHFLSTLGCLGLLLNWAHLMDASVYLGWHYVWSLPLVGCLAVRLGWNFIHINTMLKGPTIPASPKP